MKNAIQNNPFKSAWTFCGPLYIMFLLILSITAGCSKNQSCSDGIQNQGELGIDCCGPCMEGCVYIPDCDLSTGTCNDGVKNQNETGVDCGGSCPQSCTQTDVCGFSVTDIAIVNCDDRGTPQDPNDDEISFNVVIEAVSSSNQVIIYLNDIHPDNALGTFNLQEIVRIEGFLHAFVDNTLVVADANDPECRTSQSINFPSSCSDDNSECSFEILEFTLSDCNDNGTPSDLEDDFFNLGLLASSSVTGTFEAQINDIPQGTFNLDEVSNLGPFPANGTTAFNLELIHQDNSCLNLTRSFGPIAACSNPEPCPSNSFNWDTNLNEDGSITVVIELSNNEGPFLITSDRGLSIETNEDSFTDDEAILPGQTVIYTISPAGRPDCFQTLEISNNGTLLSALVDGENWATSNASAQIMNNILSMVAIRDDQTSFVFSGPGALTTGSFPLDATYRIEFFIVDETCSSLSGAGTLDINEVDNQNQLISGSFQFSCTPENGEEVNIANGFFQNVPYTFQ